LHLAACERYLLQRSATQLNKGYVTILKPTAHKLKIFHIRAFQITGSKCAIFIFAKSKLLDFLEGLIGKVRFFHPAKLQKNQGSHWFESQKKHAFLQKTNDYEIQITSIGPCGQLANFGTKTIHVSDWCSGVYVPKALSNEYGENLRCY
jgi:hypothetical protein